MCVYKLGPKLMNIDATLTITLDEGDIQIACQTYIKNLLSQGCQPSPESLVVDVPTGMTLAATAILTSPNDSLEALKTTSMLPTEVDAKASISKLPPDVSKETLTNPEDLKQTGETSQMAPSEHGTTKQTAGTNSTDVTKTNAEKASLALVPETEIPEVLDPKTCSATTQPAGNNDPEQPQSSQTNVPETGQVTEAMKTKPLFSS